MYKGLLFNKIPKARSIPPQFNYLNNLANLQYRRIRELHEHLTVTVNENNLIVQMLQSLPFRLTGDPIIDARNASSAMVQIAGTHKLVTDDTSGKIHSKAILPFKANEVIILTDTEFNVKEALANWRYLQPVKLLSHPFMDICYPLFFNTIDQNYPMANTPVVKGDSVFAFEVNLPMLVFMLSAWAIEDTKRNLRNFVAMYPIVNLIPSFMDIAYLNRYFHIAIDPIGKINNLNYNKTFSLNLAISQVNTAFDAARRRMLVENRDIPTILAEINLPFADSVSDYLEPMWKLRGNRQSRWALDVAYMPYIRGLLAIDATQSVRMSPDIKADLRIAYNQMTIGNYLEVAKGNDFVVRHTFTELTKAVKMC